MGNYACRRPGYLQAWEIAAAEFVFQGKSDEYICKQLLPVWTDKHKTEVDKKKMSQAKRKLTKLKKDERFLEYYRSILTEFSVHNYGKAMNKLVEQIDSSNEWLANKAANDVLAKISKSVIGDEEKAVTVKIEGMPELGTPGVTADDG